MDKTVAVKWMQGFDQKVEAEKEKLEDYRSKYAAAKEKLAKMN